LILDEGNTVTQNEFTFFQALNLDKVDTRDGLQRFDRSVKVAMFLPQALELCLQLDFFVFGHSQPPNPNVALSLPSCCRTLPSPTCGEGGEGGKGRPGLSAHPEKFCPPNTTIDPTMLPESLPQDQVVRAHRRVFSDRLRHLDHRKKFS
jgi:hypothetical protein